MNAYYVFLKFAKLWELQTRRRSASSQRRTRRTSNSNSEPANLEPMFSLHIDTARTWRGGQNQVLLTVNGLRAIGQRAALVAHPDGELRRRAAEGLELIPIAPRTEMDLSRGVAARRASSSGCSPDVIHAHDPHGVAMASLALSLGAAPAHGRRAGAGRVAPRRLSPARAIRSRAGSTGRSTASSPRRRRSGRCWSPTACPPSGRVTVHEGIDVEHVARGAAGQRARGVLAAASARRSSATSPRWCRTRASAT